MARKELLRREQSFFAPGFSISVGFRDRIVWSEAFGYANMETPIPVTIKSKFPIGSLSKPLTATVAMLLFERGEIDIDADVRMYIPSFPQKSHPISIRQLLAHRSGIRHYTPTYKLVPPFIGIDNYADRVFETAEQRLEIFSNDPLLFKPNTDYSYSTFGYTLVGEAISAVANVPYLDQMKHSLFEPLQMNNTEPDYFDREIENRVTSYDNTIIGQRVIKSSPENCSYKWAEGGFLSTPTDIGKFGLALLDNRIIRKETFEMMLTPISEYENSPFPQFHALGWNISIPRSGQIEFVNHGGSPTGGQACIVMIPESKVVVVIMSNSYIFGSLPLKIAATNIARFFHESSLASN